jgi:hypothetical protein
MTRSVAGFECSPLLSALIKANGLFGLFGLGKKCTIDDEKGLLITNKRTVEISKITRVMWLGQNMFRFETNDGVNVPIHIFSKPDIAYVRDILMRINQSIHYSHN